MNEQELAGFPALAAARGGFARTLPPLADAYISHLFTGHPYLGNLGQVNAAVALLLQRHRPEELSSQIRGVFGLTEADWSAGSTELFGFAHLQQTGVLDRIGWPAGFPGDTPPFEGSVLDVAGENSSITPRGLRARAEPEGGVRLVPLLRSM